MRYSAASFTRLHGIYTARASFSGPEELLVMICVLWCLRWAALDRKNLANPKILFGLIVKKKS